MKYRRWIMAMLFIVGQCVGVLSLEAQSHLTVRSHRDSVGTAYSTAGKAKIQLREIQTEILRTNGPRTLGVLVMFDPVTGGFSSDVFDTYHSQIDSQWRSAQLSDGEAAIYIKKGELTYFRIAGGPPRFYIRGYHGHAADLEDASRKSLKVIDESVDFQGDLEKEAGAHTISLIPLGDDLVFTRMHTANPSEATKKIVDLQWDGGHWIVLLEARWKARIVMDADYNLISATKVE